MIYYDNSNSSVIATTRKEFSRILLRRGTKHQLAKRSGLSYATIHKLVSTEYSIAQSTLDKIEVAINVILKQRT